jgi:riboflavin biosynthesis pyrimidine reductase
MHAAAWEAGVVDFVRLYVTPHVLGRDAVRFLNGRKFSSAALLERRTEQVGVDIMIEGYVHGPR